MVTVIHNKNAETVADAIFKEWFCKFGILAQIHTDRGKEFMELLNVSHTKTSPAHPLCNSQVEVFNKTVKKYLASFVDDTALNWETFLPALSLSYNTSYHSTIAAILFELLFGEKAQLPLRTYIKFVTVKHHLRSVSTFFRSYEKLPMNTPQQMVKKQKNNLTKMRFHIHSESVIKC